MANEVLTHNSAPAAQDVLVFERYRLDIRRRLLLENGRRVKLGSRALSLLTLLAQRAGQIVSNRELLERIWPGTCVVDAALRVQVSELQRTLGTTQWGGRFVENIYGQGYRLAEPVFSASRGDATGITVSQEFTSRLNAMARSRDVA